MHPATFCEVCTKPPTNSPVRNIYRGNLFKTSNNNIVEAGNLYAQQYAFVKLSLSPLPPAIILLAAQRFAQGIMHTKSLGGQILSSQ